MPPWYLPLLAQGIETTLSKQSKTRLGTIHNLPEREREREREQGWEGLWDPLIPQLSSHLNSAPQHLRDQRIQLSYENPAAAEQDLHRKGDSSPTSFSQAFYGEVKVSVAAWVSVQHLPVPAPLPPPFPFPSRWETTVKPFSCLTPSFWHSTHPATQWGSKHPLRVLLTLDRGKSTLSLFLP